MPTQANAIIGNTFRALREAAGLSQEKVAEKAGISYQYLSAVENGKENFTIGVMETLAQALGSDIPALVQQAFLAKVAVPVVNPAYFSNAVALPPNLSIAHLTSALNETHKIIRLINETLKKVSDRPLSAYIQRNNFSGIVSNILCDSFSRLSPYRHNHDQRYPDLICKETHPETGLEVKSTVNANKGGESHNGHSGWHVIACFSLDENSGDIRFIQIMFADLVGHGQAGADWKYQKSKVNKTTGSQRTETYITTPGGTAKLRKGTVYLDTSVIDTSRRRKAVVPIIKRKANTKNKV